MERSGWNLQSTNALNGMTYVKLPIRSNSILNIQNIDRYCFLWSILANIHPVDKSPQRVSKFEPYRDELNITNIEFTTGMRIVDIPRFEKLNPTLSKNTFEYSSKEDNDHKLVPIYISKHNQKRKIIDLILYKNHYILVKKLHVFIVKHDNHYVCRNCLSSYTIQSELKTPKRICGN